MAETTTPTTTPTAPAKPETGKMRRREPMDMFETFQDEMARLWGQSWPFGSWPLMRRTMPMPEVTAMWSPKVDVFEKDGDLVVKAELPGAKKEDIEVSLDDGMLVIKGEKKAETEVKEESYYRMEQSYGSFYRRLPLPFEAMPDQVKATYAGGILEVHIPKPTEEAKPTPKTITII